MARNSTPPSLLVISIDVDLKRVISVDAGQPDRISLADHHARVESLQQLLQLFQQARLPATWGFSDPANSRFVPELVDGSDVHEVALLGDTSWISQEAGRKGLCQHLVQRVSAVRQLGCEVSTLAIYDGDLADDYDLLAKHQISIVRNSASKQRSRNRSQRHRSLRYGLWEAPPAVHVSPAAPLWAWQPSMVINRVLRRTIRYGGVGHLVLDMTASQYATSKEMNFVRRVLKTVSGYQRSGILQVCTLRELAAQWRPPQQRVTAQSLLKIAA